MIHGFLNVDKPAGLTSHDVVARVRRVAGQKRVGHGGTLDPAATGVLPIGLGQATRLLEFLVEGRKRYHAVIKLGVTTTTDDAEGTAVSEQPLPALEAGDLQAALSQFVGIVEQVPPMYSAIQIGGRRLYDIARAGETLELAPRRVEIDRIELLSWQSPLVEVDIVCGKGTYIRSIARDLGAALGCGAHLEALRRTAVGPLSWETAVPLDQLLQGPETITQHVMAQSVAVAHLPRVELDDHGVQRLRHGLVVELQGEVASDTIGAAFTAAGDLVALVRYDGGWRPWKVLASP